MLTALAVVAIYLFVVVPLSVLVGRAIRGPYLPEELGRSTTLETLPSGSVTEVTTVAPLTCERCLHEKKDHRRTRGGGYMGCTFLWCTCELYRGE